MILNRDLLEKDLLYQVENYIITALTYFYIGKGVDVDDISIYTEPPERYDQHPGTSFYVRVCVEDKLMTTVYFNCDGRELKGREGDEKNELSKLLDQFNNWFESKINVK